MIVLKFVSLKISKDVKIKKWLLNKEQMQNMARKARPIDTEHTVTEKYPDMILYRLKVVFPCAF